MDKSLPLASIRGSGKQSELKPQTVEEILKDWISYEAARGAADKTLQAYKLGIETFIGWAGEHVPGPKVSPSDVRRFKSDLSDAYSPATVNLRLSAIRAFYRWLVVTDRLQVSPAESVRNAKQPKSRQHKRDTLTVPEIRAVLQVPNPDTVKGARDLAILTLMAYCALRTVEIVRANIDNLKTQGERLVLEVWGKGRVNADEIVVIPVDQEHIIRSWLSRRLKIRPSNPSSPLFPSLSRRNKGARLGTRSVRNVVKDAFQEAGVVGTRKTTHSLRHTAITAAIRNGAEPMQVQAMARHNSFDTTLNYIHQVSRTEGPAEDLIEY